MLLSNNKNNFINCDKNTLKSTALQFSCNEKNLKYFCAIKNEDKYQRNEFNSIKTEIKIKEVSEIKKNDLFDFIILSPTSCDSPSSTHNHDCIADKSSIISHNLKT